ncbi:hypothetical protein BaRGS_00011139 [Batillaria attramentaria]|uniref:Uncharacterized protein n=1 Tax=Batillaria attramentaria TaxID=370345 RepID=A0ABD0LDV8_9CAEN
MLIFPEYALVSAGRHMSSPTHLRYPTLMKMIMRYVRIGTLRCSQSIKKKDSPSGLSSLTELHILLSPPPLPRRVDHHGRDNRGVLPVLRHTSVPLKYSGHSFF